MAKKNAKLREKFPNSKFFWYVFSRICTEYRDLLIQYERGKRRTRKTVNSDTFHTVQEISFTSMLEKIHYLTNQISILVFKIKRYSATGIEK